jgi:tRNA A37 threonylcarbamoyladenosine dehydratase
MSYPGWQDRTLLLMGEENYRKLSMARVLVAGLGGVGAYAAEMLCRAGIGSLTLVDGDRVSASNRNRQLIALSSTEGQYKTDLMEERLKDINPDIEICKHTVFMADGIVDEILTEKFDYVVDAIDTLSPKVFFIRKVMEKAYPLVSSFGSGGKMDPLQIKVSDVSASYNCRFGHAVRKQLHRLGIHKGFTVVFSPEKVHPSAVKEIEGERNKKSAVGTISYLPASFGIAMASVIVRELTGLSEK